jgi:hypothetical protein
MFYRIDLWLSCLGSQCPLVFERILYFEREAEDRESQFLLAVSSDQQSKPLAKAEYFT